MSFDWGRRHLGVCYYPEQWPRTIWACDAQRMADAGITVVRIGEFAWSMLEPRPGELQFAWMDEAIEVLAAAGLAIVIGTPTATPPRWMLTRHPDMLAVDLEGRPRRFGSRRHYDFSHRPYREEAVRITTLLAERYGRHDAVVAWQVDNEYGCHDTVRSYSPAAREAFRGWLATRYGTIDALNAAWHTVFWSMSYGAFEEVDLPNLTVTEPNPHHAMDFRRFASDEVRDFNRAQVDAIRPHARGRTIQHNLMGREVAFDHFAIGADLDAVSWDSYPLGFLEDRSDAPHEFRDRFARQGDPDFQAFHHDLYRAVGRGRWWVMEQQPGPVNWAPANPIPLPGMVRLWAWEAFAHGAEVVSLFRWRQAPFGQEAMHAGLLTHDDAPAPGLVEVATVARELEDVPRGEPNRSPVALAFDYESAWAWQTQPQGSAFDYFALVYSAYRALRRRGLSVDILGPTLDGLADYRLALVPGLWCWSDAARMNLARVRGPVLIGPRAGAKNADFSIATMPPDLGSLLDAKVVRVESLRPTTPIPAPGGAIGLWREILDVGANASPGPFAADGAPLFARQGGLTYLAGWPDDALWDAILTPLLEEADLPTALLPEGVRVRDHGTLRVVLNYGATPAEVGRLARGRAIVGGGTLPAAGVAVFR